MRQIAFASALIIAASVPASVLARNASTYPISTSEADTLTFMREEEKLARDVYDSLQQKWSTNTFDNISISEQRHMDALKSLVDKYGLADPTLPTAGQFTNPDLQSAYDTLMARGSQSRLEAFRVGGYIEELDIRDLEAAVDGTNKADLLRVYGNLMCGSRNHLRAFSRQIENGGVAYEAQVLSQQEVDDIINSSMERCGN